MLDYERSVNFRFEEEGGGKIKTYERNTGSTLRNDKSKRAEKRQERNQRKKDQVNEMREQAQVLKSIKKSMIEQKVQQLINVSGLSNDRSDEFKSLMTDQFDGKAYDKKMDELFGEDYFQ